MKRKTTKRKSRSRLPSWNEVRIGLSQVSKLRLLFLLAKIYRSSVVPKSVKSNILSMARTGAKKIKTKPSYAKQKKAYEKLTGRKIVKPNRAVREMYAKRTRFTRKELGLTNGRKKPRSAAQKRATRKLVALNKRRRK